MGSTSATVENSQVASSAEAVVTEYAWALLVCDRRSDGNFCTTIANLVLAYPSRARLVSEEVASLIRSIAEPVSPESLMAKIGQRGFVLECPTRLEEGSSLVTLGPLNVAEIRSSECQPNGEAPTLLSVLDGYRATMPSLARVDEAAAAYYEECEAERGAELSGQPFPEEGAGDDATKSELTRELEAKEREKAAELAKKQQAVIDKSKELADAEKAEEEAQERADANPDDPQAQADADSATAHRELVESELDAATDQLEDAIAEWARADAALEHQRDNDAELQRAGEVWEAVGEVVFGDRLQKLKNLHEAAKRYFTGARDCVVAECEFVSCHGQAQASVFRDYLRAHDKEPCAEVAMPVPDSSKECFWFDDLTGNILSDGEAAELNAWICAEREKYYAPDSGQGQVSDCDPREARNLVFSDDICSDPRAMCAPESGGSGSLLPLARGLSEEGSLHEDMWIDASVLGG